jgi:hypothetical protein
MFSFLFGQPDDTSIDAKFIQRATRRVVIAHASITSGTFFEQILAISAADGRACNEFCGFSYECHPLFRLMEEVRRHVPAYGKTNCVACSNRCVSGDWTCPVQPQQGILIEA